MILVVSPDNVEEIIGRLADLGDKAYLIGEINKAETASVELI